MCQPMYASSLIVKRLVKIILASSKSWCLYHYCNHLSTCSQHLPTHSFKFQIYNLIGSRTKVYFTINFAIGLAGGCIIHDWVFQVNLVFSINQVRKWKFRGLPFGKVGPGGLLLHPSELFTFKRIATFFEFLSTFSSLVPLCS